MENFARFETPENVQIQYEFAGLGSRFLAWLIDQIVCTLFFILVSVGGFILLQSIKEQLRELFPESNGLEVVLIVAGLFYVVWQFSSFFYFGLCEYFGRGQTLGKKLYQMRVVNADGFALNGTSILIRNLARVADNLPPLWLVPFFSTRLQRVGDMLASTVVVWDRPRELSEVRTQLSSKNATEAEFRFSASELKLLRTEDVTAIEQVLERWSSLSHTQREQLVETLTSALARRLNVEGPSPERRVKFLEDLLAAEFRRQHRSL
ncbi:RDD family protein [Planctomicrobium sp. SH664]|uniref:RDD family protein n=1 Tax=Planctomicrobium sp. SH664 TaxID=3448125 RepID=UPI003F5C1E01